MALEGVAAIRKKREKDRTEKDQFTEDTENDICIKSTNEGKFQYSNKRAACD